MTKEESSFLEATAPKTIQNENGLTIFKAWLFIVGEMAGIGAMMYASVVFDIFTSTLLLIAVGSIALYSGLKLSESWTCLAEDPKYLSQTKGCKEPYPLMTQIAFGIKGRNLSRISVMVTIVFITCIFIIMTSQNINQLLIGWGITDWCLCEIMIILVVCLTPITWLPTPSDQWPIAVVAAFSTVIAFFMIAVQTFREGSEHGNEIDLVNGLTFEDESIGYLPYYVYANGTNSTNQTTASSLAIVSATKSYFDIPVLGTATMNQFAQALRYFIFGFGGMSIFPTIQTDMKRASQFNKVIIYSISTLVFLYCTVLIPGYVNLKKPTNNIMEDIDPTSLWSKGANILMTSHLITALVILSNPPMQQLEVLLLDFENGTRLKMKSIILRSLYMLSLLAFCHTVPKFGPIVDFISATTVMANSFILPSLIYLRGVNHAILACLGFFSKKKEELSRRKDMTYLFALINPS